MTQCQGEDGARISFGVIMVEARGPATSEQQFGTLFTQWRAKCVCVCARCPAPVTVI